MDIKITKCTSTANTTACNRIPGYIVIHYTAGTSSKPGTAMSNAAYFSKPSAKASADFFVDDAAIVQFNPDPAKYYCWAVGGSKYTSMTTSEGGTFYRLAKNSNCVNIEICSNKRDHSHRNATDTDWYLTDAALSHAAELTKYLMELYCIPLSHVIMHHHVTGKICPNPFCVNEAALAKWYAFKDMVSNANNSPPGEDAARPVASSVTYHHTDFVKEVQAAVGAAADGIAGPETLSKTVTVSKLKNNRHAVVKPLQKYLNFIGYSCGAADGIAGNQFDTAVRDFQRAKGCIADGEITKGKSTWRKLLHLQ